MNLNKSLVPPCKDCVGRVMLCHDTCNKYKEFKSNMQVVSTAREEYKTKRSVLTESTMRAKRQSCNY